MFDLFMENNRWASLLCSRILKRVFGISFKEDVVMLLAVTLACGFYQYENFFEVAPVLRVVLTAAVILFWLYCSLRSGFLRRGAFVLATLGYWVVPNAVIIAFNALSPQSYNVSFHMLSRFSEIMVRAPLERLAEALNLNSFILTIVLMVACEVCFTLGFLFRRFCRRSSWYCQFRARYERLQYDAY